MEHFAQRMCDDLKISIMQFAPLIAKCIRDQIAETSPFLGISIVEDARVLIKVYIHKEGDDYVKPLDNYNVMFI